MKRAILVTVLVLAALGATAAAVPWWLGIRAERSVEAIANALDGTHDLRVVKRHYRRSWLHGEGSIHIAVDGSDKEVVLRQRVEHGPFPASRIVDGRYRPLAALLRIYSEHAAQAQRLIELSAEVSLTGVVQGEFTAGEFTSRLGAQRELHVGASRGTLHLARAGTRLRGTLDLSVPRMSVREEKAQTTFTNVDLQVVGFSGDSPSRKVVVEQWTLNSAGLQFAPHAGGRNVELKGFAVDAAWSRPTKISDGRLSASCKSLAAGGTDYGPGRLEITAERIDRDALRRIDQLFAQAREGGIPPPRAEVLNAFANAARHGARLALREATLGTGEQALEVSASLQVDAEHPGLGEETVALVEATTLQLNAALPEPALRAMLAGSARRQYEQGVASGRFVRLDDEVLQTRIAYGVDLQLQNLLENGYLRRTGERYTVEATMEGGRLTVNGQPMGPAPAPG